MEDMKILSTYVTSQNQRRIAANNVITQYDLHFSVDDMTKAFEYFHGGHLDWIMYNLMYCILTTNLRMFIAVIYALLDENDKMPGGWWNYLQAWDGCYKLGYNHMYAMFAAKQVYCTLYDYYEFDITELVLSEELREHIQTHINSKFNNTKRAIKK